MENNELKVSEIIKETEMKRFKDAVNELVILSAVIEKLKYISNGGLLN